MPASINVSHVVFYQRLIMFFLTGLTEPYPAFHAKCPMLRRGLRANCKRPRAPKRGRGGAARMEAESPWAHRPKESRRTRRLDLRDKCAAEIGAIYAKNSKNDSISKDRRPVGFGASHQTLADVGRASPDTSLSTGI